MLPVVVCAHNEGPRVGTVVRALLASRAFSRVLVVDDGSTDDTSSRARQSGAEVLRLSPNRGKGGAMLAGWEATGRGDVAFFDADLQNLQPEHIERLLVGYRAGYDMSCGMQDYLRIASSAYPLFPLITGQRIVRKRVLEALPASCWSGYNIETAMNLTCDRIGGRTFLCVLPGLLNTLKESKGAGVLAGMKQNAKMLLGIYRTKQALKGSGGWTCQR